MSGELVLSIKRCAQCGIEKPTADFNRRSDRRSGIGSYCKSCVTTKNAAGHEGRRAEAKTYNAAYRAQNRDKEAARSQRYYAQHRRELIAKQTTWAKSHPEAARLLARARKAVYRALQSGRLVKPNSCEECGDANRKISAAHWDYERVLDVRWLCFSCHSVWDHAEPKLPPSMAKESGVRP